MTTNIKKSPSEVKTTGTRGEYETKDVDYAGPFHAGQYTPSLADYKSNQIADVNLNVPVINSMVIHGPSIVIFFIFFIQYTKPDVLHCAIDTAI